MLLSSRGFGKAIITGFQCNVNKLHVKCFHHILLQRPYFNDCHSFQMTEFEEMSQRKNAIEQEKTHFNQFLFHKVINR